MLAVDTNIIVRFLTDDDREQSARAQALVSKEDLFVSTTVLLETEWVLRRVYGYARTEVIRELRRFAGLPRSTLEEPGLVATALDWGERGMDFADALHLAKAEGCDAFISFDQRLAATANLLSEVKVRAP